MPGIFICYRRGDSAGFAGRLYDRLVAQFGESRVFIDIDARIPPGQDFVKVIEKRVSSCDILVALMGKRWLTARRARQRRIDDPMEFVRLEIETALNRKIPVIPALLEGASMARADQLPDSLATLPHRQAVQITHERFDEDVKRFIASLEELVKPPIAEESVSAEPPATQVDTAPVVAAQEPAIVEPGTVRTDPKDGLEYVWIPPGRFRMGAVPRDHDSRDDEKPRHPGIIAKGLWLGESPVTVGAYKRFTEETRTKMPKAPDFNPDWQKEDHPIVNVTWDEAVAYCKWAGGSLATEAEWECAARGGKSGLVYPWGNEISKKYANYDSDGTTPVGSYSVNGFNLNDMAGNVWEWCWDQYDENYYSQSPDTDPQGPPLSTKRVLRGGSWVNAPEDLRASYRLRVPACRQARQRRFPLCPGSFPLTLFPVPLCWGEALGEIFGGRGCGPRHLRINLLKMKGCAAV